MTTKQFIGTWKLVSTKFRDADEGIHHPYGQNPVGMLVYDSDGNMAGQIMRVDRQRFSGNSVFKATGDELRAAIITFTSFMKLSIGNTGTMPSTGCGYLWTMLKAPTD
jgi:Lipocalin-like domain